MFVYVFGRGDVKISSAERVKQLYILTYGGRIKGRKVSSCTYLRYNGCTLLVCCIGREVFCRRRKESHNVRRQHFGSGPAVI